MEDLTSEIKTLAKREGISLIGIAPANGWRVAKGHSPPDILPDAKSVIVMAIQTPDKIIENGKVEERENAGAEAEKEMDQVGAKIVELLIKRGHLGTSIRPNAFPLGATPAPLRTPEYFTALEKHPSHKEYLRGQIPLVYAAYMAGLGAIGRNKLLLTPQYGPRVHLGAIISNAPLTTDKPLNIDFCGKCTICEKLCIGKAIDKDKFEPEKCWRAEWELGEPIPGLPFKACPAPCLKHCPVGRLKEKYRPVA